MTDLHDCFLLLTLLHQPLSLELFHHAGALLNLLPHVLRDAVLEAVGPCNLGSTIIAAPKVDGEADGLLTGRHEGDLCLRLGSGRRSLLLDRTAVRAVVDDDGDVPFRLVGRKPRRPLVRGRRFERAVVV